MAPESSGEEVLGLLHQGWEHLRHERPLAAWAAWQRALRLAPDDKAAHQALDRLAAADDLPAAARCVYRFRMPAGPAQRARWDAELGGRDWLDLSAAREAFRSLIESDPADAAAWYNDGLCLAWLGANAPAIHALERAVSLEAESAAERACDAWALAEILRQGGGAEHLADELSHALSIARQPGDPEPDVLGTVVAVPPPIDPVLEKPRFADVQAFEWLDRPFPEPSATLSAAELPRVLATVIQTPRSLRLSSPDPELLAEAQNRLARAMVDGDRPFRRQATPLPLALLDAAIWTFRLPEGCDTETRRQLSRDAVEHFYENVWIHWPRHGLDGRSPLEAAQEGAPAGVKLAGIIQVREQLGARARTAELYGGYPFDRLRRRLGLAPHDPNLVEPDDPSCMSGSELDRLDPAGLNDMRLGEAFTSAAGLGDDRRTARFATALAGRGAAALAQAGVDLTRLFASLVRQAMAEGEPADALRWLDCAQDIRPPLSGSAHERTFATWRAEVLARSDQPDAALAVYQRLLEHAPGDARLALDAAETLFDRGYPDQAAPLARQALDCARAAGDAPTLARAESLLANLPDSPVRD